jgi:hydrogenase maturation factor
MRRLLLIPLFALALTAHASDTLRIGQQVLSVGDTAAHAIDLLGTPAYKEPLQNEYGAFLGERWQYSREQGHVVEVTIIAGRITAIDDHIEEHTG